MLMTASGAMSAVKLNCLFADGAVLQRDMPVPVWGTANTGERVTVLFGRQKVSTVARDGKWMVRLKPLKAGGPYVMTVKGENTITLNNIFVGEVWVCSGQSNMEFPLIAAANATEVIANSANPMLHLCTVKKNVSDTPLDDATISWQECGPGTSPGFSAVGYFFARDLQKALNVPVGIIHSSWGGSFAEAWTSPAVLAKHPELQGISAEIQKIGPPHKPSILYNGMLHPLIPFAIRGAIWYQGESNAGRAYMYRTLFPTMIKNWRDDWGEGDFPFLFVQLAPFYTDSAEPGDSAWAELREAQLLTTTDTPKTGMAVITDVGDAKNIHPTRKEPVGARLALAARAIAYGEKIEYSGPVYRSMQIRGDRAILSFDHAGSGLTAKDGDLKGFAIAGSDHKFVWAHATIQGDKVVVSSERVESPVAVRYGWANCPDVNLFNNDGIPATPFRTDDFPTTTK
jgi:sialate O-acetylesterase